MTAPRFGQARQRKASGQSGFTVIELMITVFVAVSIAALAAPSFTRYVADQRIRSAANDLSTTLLLARSESIKRNAAVNVVKASSGWAGGWQVQFPGVSPPTVVRSQTAYSSISITNSANLSTITFNIDGRTSTSSTSFRIQPAIAVSGVTARCVFVTPSGTPRSTVGGC